MKIEKSSWDKQRFNWRDDIARDNLLILKDYKGAAHKWRCNANKLENASFGEQYSKAETKALFAFKQAPLPISVSTAILDTADAMMVSNKAEVYTAPIIFNHDEERTQRSRAVASKFSQLLQGAWNSSLGNLQADRIVRDQGRVGHGLMYIRPKMEHGEFSVSFDHLSWRYFFQDPSSRDPLYRDMDNSVYAMPMTVKNAFKLIRTIDPTLSYKEFIDEFVTGSPVEHFQFDTNYQFGREASYYQRGGKATENSKHVLFIRRATLEEETVYVVVPLKAELNKTVQGIDFKTYPEHNELLMEMEKRKEIKVVPKRRFQLVEYLSIGNYGRKKVLAIQDHDIVGFPYDHRDNPYPNSRMTYIYPLQRALNKFIMSAILNQSLMNTLRILAEKGSITNMEKFTRDASVPGVVIEYELVTPGSSQPPKEIRPEPMHEAWLTMPRFMLSMMEYVSGIFGSMMGNSEGAPNVFSTVASLASAGGQKFKRRMAMFDATLSQAGRVAATYYKEYAPPNGYSVTVDESTGTENIIKFNTLKTVRTKKKDSKGREKYDVITDPNEDLSLGFRDVRFTTRASAGYESATEAMLLTQLATQGGAQGLIPMILQRLNIPGVDKYLREQNLVKQLSQQTEQQQKVIKELERKSKILENQIFQGIKQLEQARFKGKFDTELQKFKDDPLDYIRQATTNQGER